MEPSNHPIMNLPIMQVYQPPAHSQSTIAQGAQWDNPDPRISPFIVEQPQGPSSIQRVPYSGTPSVPDASYQPTHAFSVRDTYAGGNWPAQTVEPYDQPHPDHSPYGFVAHPPQGQGYWGDPTHLPYVNIVKLE